MRHSLGLPTEITNITSCAVGPPSAISQVCAYCIYHISRAEEAKNIYDSETHQETRAYSFTGTSRSAATFIYREYIEQFSLCRCARLCCKPTFECLVYPDLRVSICCFSSRNGTSIIVSSTLVASRGVTGQ